MCATVVLAGIWFFTLWGSAWTEPAASAPPDLPAFPRWQPPPAADHPPEMGEPDLHSELTSLYQQGLRDQAAGPEFLQTMKRILASAQADPKRATSKAPWKILAFHDSLLVLDGNRVVLAVSDSTFPSGSIAIEAIHLKGHFTGIRVDPL